MTTDQVNILNIGLMVASAAAAFALPFETFLFSYAVLGPLHYLTQISWLHSRGYFTTAPRDYWLLGALAAVLLCLKYVAIDRYDMQVMPFAAAVVMVLLAVAASMAFTSSPLARVVAIGAALAAAALAAGLEPGQVVLLSLLPTIIHVFCFTAVFILHGALRGRSRTGMLSLAVFVACAVLLLAVRPVAAVAMVSDGVRGSYDLFSDLNVTLASWFGAGSLDDADAVYTSPAGVALMRFIAFAYTYHYLNWFSKTSVIQWHKVPVAWSVANIALWLAAVALYAHDYRSGTVVLFSLSWLHVILELPLDFKTFGAVAGELGSMLRG